MVVHDATRVTCEKCPDGVRCQVRFLLYVMYRQDEWFNEVYHDCF
jgi:hypothetical protein